MGKGAKWARWSEQEDQQILELCTGKSLIGDEPWIGIAENFTGRSAMACRQRWFNLKARAEGKPPRARYRDRKANGRIQRRTHAEIVASKPAPPPPHTSWAAEHLGDPPPGRSALDQKRAGIVDQPYVPDKRYSDYRPRITLATEPMR